MRRHIPWYLLAIMMVVSVGAGGKDAASISGSDSRRETVNLNFQLTLNRHVYEESAWGSAPQLAIWVQNESAQRVHTVMVTHRMGACDWKGKAECGIALPHWITFYNRETATQGPPTWKDPVVDGISRATPKAKLTAAVEVPHGGQWRYFIEVNVSGDFNERFPRMSEQGESDSYGNGQPSLVYSGAIEATAGASSPPKLLGRTDQYELITHVIEEMEGIDNAKDLIREMNVSCVESCRPH